jgi:hypothetical protein
MAHFKHRNIVSDLKELIRLLKKYKFEAENYIELYRLNNIIGQSNNVFYKYDTDDVVFNVTTSGMDVNPVVKKISVSLNVCYTLNQQLSDKNDIFQDYNFNLHIKGYPSVHDSPEDFSNFFCWHLDKEPNTNGNLTHPYYHFHAGGNHLHGKNIGELLMISSPRIPHPPMDILLSIHFVINNFFNTKDFKEQKEILKDDDYILIMERAQKRVLEPYFSTISGEEHANYSRYNLFPLFV